jgi:hypothetical protein
VLQQQQGSVINAGNNGQFVDLTADDEDVSTAAQETPSVPPQEAVQAPLPTPSPTPPKAPTPEPPSNLHDRLPHLHRTIIADKYPCAFRLLRSFEALDKKQQRKYSALFWPTNEEALSDMLSMAELSPNFSDIYYRRISWHFEESKIDAIQDAEMKAKAHAEFTAAGLAQVAEMKRTCKAAFEDRLAEERLGQLRQLIGNVKGKKSKRAKAAQREAYEKEVEREAGERRERWAKLGLEKGSDELVGEKRKRGDEDEGEEVESGPAPAPEKKGRGRPKKVKTGEEAVPKEKKARGRPRKVVKVAEQTPDPTPRDDKEMEDDDDDALEAAILAGLNDDSGDEDAVVEPPCQLQGLGDDTSVDAATAEDLLAAFFVDSPAPDNAVEGDEVPQELDNQEAEEERDDDVDSLFGDEDADDAMEVDSLPQESANEEAVAADDDDDEGDILDAFLAADDGTEVTDDFLVDWEGREEMFALIDRVFDFW